jgi:serine protease Do
MGGARVGVIGALFQQVMPDIAAALGDAQLHGAIVTSVQIGGPADQAELQVGDVVTAAGNRAPADERALLRIIAGWPIGSAIPLSVWRCGTVLTIAPVVRALPASAQGPVVKPPSSGWLQLGRGLAALTPALRSQYKQTADETGIVVASVEQGSVAAQLGLRPGDVIMRVGARQITRVEEMQQAVEEAKKNERQFVLLLVQGQRGAGGMRYHFAWGSLSRFGLVITRPSLSKGRSTCQLSTLRHSVSADG